MDKTNYDFIRDDFPQLEAACQIIGDAVADREHDLMPEKVLVGLNQIEAFVGKLPPLFGGASVGD